MLNLLTVATATAGASQTSYGDQLSFDTMRASQKRDEPGRMGGRRLQISHRHHIRRLPASLGPPLAWRSPVAWRQSARRRREMWCRPPW